MKTIVTTIAAAALAFGVTAAQAQSSSAEANVKADSSMSAPKHKHMTRQHHRYRGQTTGIGRENNAAAPGSVLPGKDRLQTKGFIEYH